MQRKYAHKNRSSFSGFAGLLEEKLDQDLGTIGNRTHAHWDKHKLPHHKR